MEIGILYHYNQLVDMLGEEAIVRKYVPNFKAVNISFRLRNKSDDTRPSCRVFRANQVARLYIKDFGDSDFDKALSIIEFIQREHSMTYREAVEMIRSDFKNDITRVVHNRKSVKYTRPVKKTTLLVQYREWRTHDIEYWNSYNITVKQLEAADIKPISYYWIDSEVSDMVRHRADKYAYSYDYYWLDGIFRRKIYQPFRKNGKWYSNADKSIVQNYKNLQKEGDLLVIQSSLKDSLVMNAYGYLSIAPISEAAWFTDEYWFKIVERYTDVIFFGNNDWNKPVNEGLNYAEKISKRYSIPYVLIPSEFECSDISDFRKKYGDELTKELINSLNL